jgi:hypothetical protein
VTTPSRSPRNAFTNPESPKPDVSRTEKIPTKQNRKVQLLPDSPSIALLRSYYATSDRLKPIPQSKLGKVNRKDIKLSWGLPVPQPTIAFNPTDVVPQQNKPGAFFMPNLRIHLLQRLSPLLMTRMINKLMANSSSSMNIMSTEIS